MARRSITVALILALFTAGWITAASASPADESSMIGLINGERSAQGLNTLCGHGDLTAFARGHTADMIAAGSIFHSSNLGSAATGWTAMGENVGMGPNVSVLHGAFMNSSGHRANILGDYTHIGVGIDLASDGTMFVTVVFMKASACGASPTTTTTAPPATTTTTAPPATTTTTAPPATTTTVAATTPDTGPRTASAPVRPLLDVPMPAPAFCRDFAFVFSVDDNSCVD